MAVWIMRWTSDLMWALHAGSITGIGNLFIYLFFFFFFFDDDGGGVTCSGAGKHEA